MESAAPSGRDEEVAAKVALEKETTFRDHNGTDPYIERANLQ